MVEVLFWVIVGAFVGWNLPQPWYAKTVQRKVVELWERVTTGSK